MNFISKKLFVLTVVLMTALFSFEATAQESKDKKSTSCSTEIAAEKTSGCLPSSCRGAQTKFGEAKVISELRDQLIALKAMMEASTSPSFDADSYTIGKVTGETDEESIELLTEEIRRAELAIEAKLPYKPTAFQLPENKAQQVAYLESRVSALKEVLK